MLHLMAYTDIIIEHLIWIREFNVYSVEIDKTDFACRMQTHTSINSFYHEQMIYVLLHSTIVQTYVTF